MNFTFYIYFIIMIYNDSLSDDLDLAISPPGFPYAIHKHKLDNSMQGMGRAWYKLMVDKFKSL
jgi:hypothetical protein